MNRDDLIENARSAGADLVGIAPVERFDELPVEKHPRAIFPETRSVIVLGRRITRGTLRGVEEGTNFGNYRLYGIDWLSNRFLSYVTFRVAEYLEDNRWEAVPLPNLPPDVPPMGVPVGRDRPAPNVLIDMDDAAVRAGLGQIGYFGGLLTPRFGTRQRVQAILTDAVLEPDPLPAAAVCPHDAAFASFCPLEAVRGEREIAICGLTMRVADLDPARCKACQNGAVPNPYHPAGPPDRIAAACQRAMLDYLEQHDCLSSRFKARFRARPPWRAGGAPAPAV